MQVQFIDDELGINKQTVLDCLRSKFDDRKTCNSELIKIMKATKGIDKDAFEEMESDLITMGVLN